MVDAIPPEDLSVISAIVLTKNSSTTLKNTLESLAPFHEVIVYDTGSSDDTLAIAKQFPYVRIEIAPFIGFGPTHNQAANTASYDWILSIDSDEVLSPELSKEILTLSLDARAVYKIPRLNFFNGKQIRGCSGWYPDPVIRLYNRKTTHFSTDAVHEKILSSHLKCIPLSSPLLHTPYRTIEDFLHKMQFYSTLFSEQHKGKKKGSLLRALIHSYAAFFKSYFLKKGIFFGKEGLIISLYNAHVAFYKYLKLAF